MDGAKDFVYCDRLDMSFQTGSMGRAMLFDLLASNYPITCVVVLGFFMVWSRNKSAFASMVNDPDRWGRRLARGSFGAIAAFLVWVTIFDNWRQLLGFLVDAKERWRSDLYLYEPPSDFVRTTTWLLLGLSVLGGASLFARYGRGYILPPVLSLCGVVGFFVLNSMRMTFEPAGPLSERGVDFTNVLDAIMTLIWFGIFYVVMAILIYCAYLILWGPAALAAEIVYRSTFGRQEIQEPEMFRIIRERSTLPTSGDGSGSNTG